MACCGRVHLRSTAVRFFPSSRVPLGLDPKRSGNDDVAPLPWLATWRTVGIAALILLFRRPEALLRPRFWADDGATCFKDAIEQGGGRVLLTPFQGYLHLVPRLLAWAADALAPVFWRPAFYGWSALVVALLVVMLICRYCRVPLPGGPPTRAALALALFLVPHDGEAFLTLAALQWLFAPLLVLLTLQRPAVNRAELLADAALVVTLGLTGPMLPLVLPLWAFRWFLHGRPRAWGEWGLFGVTLLVAGVQAWTVGHSHRVQFPPLTHNWRRWTFAVGYQFPGRLFFGRELPEMFGAAFWVLTPLLLLLGAALWLAAGRRERGGVDAGLPHRGRRLLRRQLAAGRAGPARAPPVPGRGALFLRALRHGGLDAVVAAPGAGLAAAGG